MYRPRESLILNGRLTVSVNDFDQQHGILIHCQFSNPCLLVPQSTYVKNIFRLLEVRVGILPGGLSTGLRTFGYKTSRSLVSDRCARVEANMEENMAESRNQ